MSDTFTIYPVYFDTSKKLTHGRKYPRTSCFTAPRFEEICEALKMLEIEFTGEPAKRHPCDPFNFGRVKVKKIYSKKSVVNGVKSVIDEVRAKKLRAKVEMESEKSEKEKKGYIKNEMNLVPKKKVKGKKK